VPRENEKEGEREGEVERNRTTIIIVKTEYLAGQRRRLCAGEETMVHVGLDEGGGGLSSRMPFPVASVVQRVRGKTERKRERERERGREGGRERHDGG